MGEQPTESEIEEEIYGRKKDILESLRFYGGRETVSAIKSESGCPEGSVHHHLRQLEETQLVRRDGEEPIGSGGTSDAYRLTSRGSNIIENLTERTATADDVEDLIDQIEQHGDAIERHGETIDDLQESHDEILESLEVVKAHLGIDEDDDDEEAES